MTNHEPTRDWDGYLECTCGWESWTSDDTYLVHVFQDLDNVIRKVDGLHDLGAGALAEAIRAEILGEEA